MKLLVFLGNPGEQYQQTRHNAGFLIADLCQKKFTDINWHYEKKFSGMILETINFNQQKAEKIIMLKPDTFMNLSGKAVKKISDYFTIKPAEIMVIHDDKDLPFGSIRLKHQGGHGGHRGISNIIDLLQSDEFARLKVGIENRPTDYPIATSDFVLSKFTKEELKKLEEVIFPSLEKIILDWLLT